MRRLGRSESIPRSQWNVRAGPFIRFTAGGVVRGWVLLYSPLGESSTTNMSKAPALSTKNTQSEAVSQLVRCL
jgi:hypothetical protein